MSPPKPDAFFCPFSLKSHRLIKLKLKVEEASKKCKTIKDSSPKYPLSNDATFSQNQTGATFPVKTNISEKKEFLRVKPALKG
jgi:hypothetical protein